MSQTDTDFFVQKIADGMIFSVDWQGIREMLGEEKDRKHVCSLHPYTEGFLSTAQNTANFSEEEIRTIIRNSDIRWMRETYEQDNPLYPILTRYFSAVEPKAGQWLRIPT